MCTGAWMKKTSKEHLKLDDKGEPLPWTLDAGLERLLNGFMLGKDGSTIAYDNFEPGDFELLNKFCNFVDKIKLVRDVFSPNLNITTLEWTDKLQSLLLNNFFVLDEESKEEVEAIRQILSEMNEAVNNLRVVRVLKTILRMQTVLLRKVFVLISRLSFLFLEQN